MTLKSLSIFTVISLLTFGSAQAQAAEGYRIVNRSGGLPTYTGNSIDYNNLSRTGASAPIPPLSQQYYRPPSDESIINEIRLQSRRDINLRNPNAAHDVTPRQRRVNYFNGDSGIPVYRTSP